LHATPETKLDFTLECPLMLSGDVTSLRRLFARPLGF
jgi:hypothetical protein